MKRQLLNHLFTTGLVLVVLLAACEKNVTDNNTPATTESPLLPPTGSMTMDMSAFDVGASSLAKATQTNTKNNFANAAIRVAIVNTAVIVRLTPPAAVFAAALTDTPSVDTKGKYHWNYELIQNQINFQAELTGWIEIKTTKAKWEMVVSTINTNPILNDFKWYEGWANLLNTSGQWTFYDSQKPTAPQEMITLDWQYTNETNKSLVFTNVDPTNANYQDVLTYSALGDDRKIEYYDISTGFNSIVFWSDSTTAG